MSRYRISESVQGNQVNSIHGYDDLGIHHPTANALGIRTGRVQDFQHGRPHSKIDGRFEEVRPLADGRTLVKKDFVLSHDGDGPVRIPSPAGGYIHYRNDHYATVDIFDMPCDRPGARLLAQVLHMDARTFELKEGAAVAYGQPLGVMAHTGLPNGIHAHVEAEPVRFRQYLRDIDTGVITPETYPGKIQGSSEIAYQSSDFHLRKERHGSNRQERREDSLQTLQKELSALGYRDFLDQPLVIDGHLGPNTLHAIKSFQHAHHLHVDGIVGPRTLAAMEEAKRYPLLSEATHPHQKVYQQVLDGIHKLPHSQQPRGQQLENAAVALTMSARQGGLHRVDHVVLGANGVNLFAVQGRPDDPGHRRVHVELAHAVMHALDHRSIPQQAPELVHAMAAVHQQPPQRGPVMMGP